MKLNIGCGRNVMAGWVNIDFAGPDIAMDLDQCGTLLSERLGPDSVDEILMSHVIEHLRFPLPLMQELWTVAKPGAICTIRCPYGSSNDADEDPTHVRRMYQGSFGYFSQPYYWRANYGYHGDWQPDAVQIIPTQRVAMMTQDERWRALETQRNVVEEMIATMRAVKPRREPLRELQVWPTITF